MLKEDFMRRENRGKNKINSNTTIFITGGALLLAIATFVITFIIYSNRLESDLYALDSEYIAQYTNSTQNNIDNNAGDEQTASASSSIGKTVEESKSDTITEQKKKEEVKESTTKKESKNTSTKKTTKTNKK